MAASSSSGPVHRNFAGNGQSAQRKQGGKNAVRALFVTLIFLAIGLSALAIHLSRQVVKRSISSSSSTRSSLSHLKVKNLSKTVKAASRARDVAATEDRVNVDANSQNKDAPLPIDTNDNSSNKGDRVYCMVPFIWNEEIYNAIMSTWGKRCDVINFLTDSVVGGILNGDKITETEYKPYWEYPVGTFPDNVVFINMTRTWHDCPVDEKTGVKKVCRHIWEKMWVTGDTKII